MLRDQKLVGDFSKRGPRFWSLCTPAPTAISDILEYLQDCNFVAYPAPLGEGRPKYVFQGALVTLETLLAIANEHRAKRSLPLFHLIDRPN
jgi:hypothetical protein